MRKATLLVSSIASACLLVAGSGLAQNAPAGHGNGHAVLDPAGIQRLKLDTRNNARVSVSNATGAASFVSMAPGIRGDLMSSSRSRSAQAKSMAFLNRYAGIFGLKDPGSELMVGGERTDLQGGKHLTYFQYYRGVPVFAGVLKTHFSRDGDLTAVNGSVVPEIDVRSTPSRTAHEAAGAAFAAMQADHPGDASLAVGTVKLYIYRAGLAQGVNGSNHLAWEVEVGNGSNVREFLYVDAHTGKVVDRLPGIMDGLYRRAYDGLGPPNGVPPSYPDSPFWEEGDPFPTGTTEADNMILASQDTYGFYFNAFGRDSFDGAGAIMDSIFNRGYSCPNASWNGTFISFCLGLTTDDVTGHEWSHAYTEYTDNLIYAWQPGALNESYSDIFGETIDQINGRGTDVPNTLRLADNCSTFGGVPPPSLTITGGSAAGSYFARASVNEPPIPFTIGPTAMAVVSTAAPFQATGACGAVSGVSGMIAIVDWTLTPGGANECGSGTRANNARLAGATGIIFVAPPAGLLNLGSSSLIGSVEVTYADGTTIKNGLPASATIAFAVGTDNSVRWLLGEDDTAVGLSGPLRDMWNPRCFGNPGKVSDTFEYACSTADGGGVHTNSGVPNHAYALITDGGTYNGYTINGIGLTKAAHVYFRAKMYQGPATNFADHADAVEQAATDLMGVNLPDLNTGAPSGEIITAADIAEIQKAMLAVEMRNPPVQCNFQPLLAQDPPPLCDGGFATQLFHDTFDAGNSSKMKWSVSHEAVSPSDFTERDWMVVSDLPDGRPGSAFFGADPDIGTCAPGGDESAVLHLDSPQITIPASVANPMLTLMHWVATEAGWDGGNIKISVNGGPWTLIQAADFVYNPYNTSLATVAQGNTNPLAGEQAFSGTDGGAVDGTWGRSIINLAPYATAKDKIRLRFDIGNDGCTGRFGWYVDDVMVYRCHN
jgi:Zn-dependent metalloprotease